MLDASAGSGAPRADGMNSARTSDSTAQPKPQDGIAPASADATTADTGSTQAKATGTAPAPVNEGQIDPQAAGSTTAPVVTPVDLTILVQAIPADLGIDNAASGLPSGKAKGADKAAAPADTASSDKKDGGDDATSAATPDVMTAIPAATIVAVVAPPAAPTDVLASPNIQGASGAASPPSIVSPSTLAASDTNKAPAGEPAPIVAAASNIPAAASDIPAIVVERDAPADTPAPTVEIAPVDPTATEKSQSAEPAATSQASAKAGALVTAGLPDTGAKTPTGVAPQTGNRKTERDKTSATTVEKAGKANDASHADTKRTEPHPAADEAQAGSPAEPDAKTPSARQPREQAAEHSSPMARAAFTPVHGDVPAPTSPTQPLTAPIGTNAPMLALAAAAPASPLQSLWQASPQRAEPGDNAVPIAGVAVEIVSRAQDGMRRFEIRLDPPELGRIDVRLDVDNGGNVTSRLTVERAETLDLLRRDAPQLERALQHAGLSTEGGLQFSLRDQNFANRDQTPRNAPTFIVPDDEPAAAEAARRGYGRLIGLGGGIDIRV
jgi:flagellar hook-length control protein FliK